MAKDNLHLNSKTRRALRRWVGADASCPAGELNGKIQIAVNTAKDDAHYRDMYHESMKNMEDVVRDKNSEIINLELDAKEHRSEIKTLKVTSYALGAVIIVMCLTNIIF